MHSCIYTGHVHHLRRRPKRHRLHYRVFSLFIDLDDFEKIDADNRLFCINRPGLFSFWERDHGIGEETGLKAWALDHLRRAGFDTEGVSVRLLCYPRILGYAFNPLSVYYCYDSKNTLIATLHEVNNTFGEKHTYVLPAQVRQADAGFRQETHKNLAVSPFTSMDATYRFEMNDPSESIDLHIGLHDNDGPVMSASFSGDRHELSDQKLVLNFLQYPLMTFKVTLGIHFEALCLWLKGVPLVARTPAKTPITASHQSRNEPQPTAE
jgi:uncharacterized protein